MTKTHTEGTKLTDPGPRSRWLGLLALIGFGALIAVVGIAVGQAGETGMGEPGPIVQHGPAQRLDVPKAARAQATGASATLLPTGRWLLLGGTRTDGKKSTAAARLYDADKRKVTTLKTSLLHARAYHTATLLADGRILVLGGVEREGRFVRAVEFFDPIAGSVEAAPDLGLMARARHRATLLTDARVLVTGGIGDQDWAIDEAELFDPESGVVEHFNARLDRARFSHLAALLPSHNVLVWGGIGTDGAPVQGAEIYDPTVRQFHSYDAESAALALTEIKSPAAPTLIDSQPPDGAEEVDGRARISLRFSKPLLVTSLNVKTIALVGPEGQVPVTITPTEGGLLAFVLPKEELLPSSDYALIVQGATDRERQPLPFTAIGFKTRAFEPTGEGPTTGGPGHSSPRLGDPGPGGNDPTDDAPTATDPSGPVAEAAKAANKKAVTRAETEDGESFVLGAEQRQGHWRTGRPLPEAVVALRDFEAPHRKRIEHLRGRMHRDQDGGAAKSHGNAKRLVDDPTVTGVGGTVLRLNDKPLAGVTVTIGKHSVRTDRAGRFELTDITPGHHELQVDGRTVAGGKEYLSVFIGVGVRKQGLTELSYAVYLPRVRAKDWFEVASPTGAEITHTHPDLPGVPLLQIPKDTVFRDRQGKILTRVALVPVPLDRSPYPTPAAFSSYFMLHPGGARVQGTNPKGIRIVYPNSTGAAAGAEHEFWVYDPRGEGWKLYGKGSVSADGTQVEPDAGVGVQEFMGFSIGFSDGPPSPNPKPPVGDRCGKDGDPVDCATGLFLHARTDVAISDDMPIAVERTYRPGDTAVRPFGKGTNHPYGIYVRKLSASIDLLEIVLPDGGSIELHKISGTSVTDSVWEHTATPSRFYGARMSFFNEPGTGIYYFALTLKDGTVYLFDGKFTGLLKGLKDKHGNRLYFTYSAGRIQRITTQNGRYVDFQYDTLGRITQIKDLLGRIWSYEYTAGGYLSKATYPEGTYEEYTYDTAGRMLTVRDRRGNTMVTNEYDANGRVTRQTLADGAVFNFAYTLDANDKVTETQVTDPRGYIRRRQFNVAGYITSLTRALGTPLEQTVTYTRNAANFVTQMTDALGRVTHYEYDTKGNETQETRLFGTPDAVSWSYSYEPNFNQVASMTDALGHTTSYTHDSTGNLTRLEDALGNRTDMTYDTAGHLLTTTRTVGGTPLTTTFAYDASDLIEVRDPLNRATELFPDALGRVIGVRDPLGRHTRSDYDTLDRVVRETDPQDHSVQYSYDGHGNLLTFTDAKNQVTTFTYDPRDRVASKTDALLTVESYQYDPAGNLLFHTDRKGQMTGQSYDTLDRRTVVGYGASSTSSPVYTSTTSYNYDAADRLTAVDSESGTITRSYDDRFDSVTEETSPQGTVSYTYAADGQRASMIPTGGTPITYDYDAAKRLTGITQGAGTGLAIPPTAQSVGFTYDEAQRPTRLTLPNGITLDYGYDAASELQAITYQYPNGTTLGDLTYNYDALGNRTAIDGSLARTGLPQASNDAQYDANNRLISRDGVPYTYDANGNLTSDGTSTYTWNERNQLTEVSGPDTLTYAYDGLGRRIQVTKNGQSTSTLYDGWNPVQLKEGTTVVENRLTGLGLDETYARTRGGVTESYLTDALGSTVELRDSLQAQTTQYTYEPYGGTADSGTSTNVAKYTGREQDIADLYYYRNRYYKPSLGRFISEDPIGLAGGGNVYSYAENNPLSFIDPYGLSPQQCATDKNDKCKKPPLGLKGWARILWLAWCLAEGKRPPEEPPPPPPPRREVPADPPKKSNKGSSGSDI